MRWVFAGSNSCPPKITRTSQAALQCKVLAPLRNSKNIMRKHGVFLFWAVTFPKCFLYFPLPQPFFPIISCSATRFLRNSDRILEKKAPVLRNISEARSLASAAPKTAGRPTQEGGLFRLREGRLLPPLSLPFRPPGEVTLPALRPGLLRAPGRLHWPLRSRRTPSTRRPQAPTRCRQSRTSTSCRCAIPSRPCCMRHALRGAVSTRGTTRGGSRSASTWKGSPRASGSARRR